MRFIFREFPLDELAAAAAMLARCIDPQNGEKAMAVIDVLFHSQDKWAVRNPVPQLQQIAKQAGMTQKAFEECLANQKLYNDLLAMRERGSKEYKVESTPTLFVNGKMQKGGATIEQLEKLIDAAAAEELNALHRIPHGMSRNSPVAVEGFADSFSAAIQEAPDSPHCGTGAVSGGCAPTGCAET